MLFEGWGLHLSPAPDHVEGHPFHASNNVNGIGIRSIVDYQVLPLDPRVPTLQEAYIRQVVDTVHDLPNVLWEVANESSGGGLVDRAFAETLGLGDIPDWGDSTKWQYWVIDVIKRHQEENGYDGHPTGMTVQFPVSDQTRVNDPLLANRADWISPGYDDDVFAAGGHPMAPDSPQSHWLEDPPAADGRKVVITDTDHHAPGRGDALWAWKSFARGHPDPHGLRDHRRRQRGRSRLRGRSVGDGRHATIRRAHEPAGHDAEGRSELHRVRAREPRPEYPVLQVADFGDPFTVVLDEPGTYSVAWFSINDRQSVTAS